MYYYVEIQIFNCNFVGLKRTFTETFSKYILQEKFHTFLYLKRIDLRKSVVKLFTYVSSSEYQGLLGS